MYFDGALNALGKGIGVVIISPEGYHTPFTARLCINCTNIMAEYEACIMGLRAAIDLRRDHDGLYILMEPRTH